MNTFRTDVSVIESPEKIGLKTPILTAGSCFADAIGQRLYQYKFKTLVNPFGVAYNPISIHQQLLKSIANEPPPEHTFLQTQGLVVNYDFHSGFYGTTRSALSAALMDVIGSTHYFLRTASWLMITYGTSWVYNRIDTGEVVANCHKVPSDKFEKRLLTETEITESFGVLIESLRLFNPAIRVILTVSPVRHLKDTPELNSVSKAILRTACHTLSTTYDNVRYFPAFEIMMDDLRDYRFYKSDMIHPTDDAEDYIWDKFQAAFMENQTVRFTDEWDSILRALRHRPFHPESAQHQQFLKQTLRQLEKLAGVVDIEPEYGIISAQLKETSTR